MSWGIQVTSPEGYTIIDGSSPMVRLLKKEFVEADPSGYCLNEVLFGTSLNYMPLVFAVPTGNPDFDNPRVKVRPDTGPPYDHADICNTASDCWVYVFLKEEQPSSETWGIRAWNGAGKLVFDSGRQMLRLINFFQGTLEVGQSVTLYFAKSLTYIPPVWFNSPDCEKCENGRYYWAKLKYAVECDRISIRCDGAWPNGVCTGEGYSYGTYPVPYQAAIFEL